MSTRLVEHSQLGIMLIDAQPVFWDGMDGPQESVLVRIERLLMLAGCLELPVIATLEHPVEQKGLLPERLARVLPAHGQSFIKRTYNCCVDEHIHAAIKQLAVSQFVVAGAETDVCVLLSVLGLLQMGYQVFLLEDCLFTSEPHPGPALERMYGAGAIPCTLKTLIYELTQSVDYWSCRLEESAVARSFHDSLGCPEKLPAWNYKR